MKVDIQHVEKSQGLVFRKKLHGVALTVSFSQEELQIINERKLAKDRIIERGVPADVDAHKHANKGLGAKLVTAVVKGTDALTFDLTIAKLMKGTDTFFFETPLEAKGYEQEVREAMPRLKAYIVENAGIEQKSDSFDL